MVPDVAIALADAALTGGSHEPAGRATRELVMMRYRNRSRAIRGARRLIKVQADTVGKDQQACDDWLVGMLASLNCGVD